MITLMTDFGLSDTFIGVMKGVIWSIVPNVQIVDLTHDIRPQNVMDGAFAIAEAAPFFPAGTIHVGVVDPGVGTLRRPMAACIGGQYFVGPDNGLFSLVIEKSNDLTIPPVYMELNKKSFWLPRVSQSFHGRDIFAPVAAHLAAGTAIEELGDPFENPVKLDFPKPQKTAGGWMGQVMKVDHFGNLITNFSRLQLPAIDGIILKVGNTTITNFVTTFGNRPAGELITMIDSGGHLAVSVVNGSAAVALNVAENEPVRLTYQPEAFS